MSAEPILVSLLPDTATLSDHDVTVGGVSLRDLAATYGTPLFVYDEATLRSRCREAASVFDDGVAFASKAFLCGAMARLAFEGGLCIDVATGGELDIVLRSGVPASRIIMHGNNKSHDELERAIAVGVHRVVVDNFDEIERLRSMVSPSSPLDCLVRVTPGVEAHTHEFVRTGQEDTKFGFSVATGEARRAISTLIEMPGLTLHGVHAHIGSQIFDVAAFKEMLAILADFTRDDGLDELCVGGGLGVAYVQGEPRGRARRRSRPAGAVDRRARPGHRRPGRAHAVPRRGREARDPAHVHGRRRRDERQPAPRPLRVGLRGL
jgi:diaminopimelate decarboxylase